MGLCLVDPFSNPSMYAILACRQTPGVGNIRITWQRRFCVCRTVFSIVSGVWLHTAVRLFEGRATRLAKQCCLSVGFVHKHATKLDDVRIPFTWTAFCINPPPPPTFTTPTSLQRAGRRPNIRLFQTEDSETEARELLCVISTLS